MRIKDGSKVLRIEDTVIPFNITVNKRAKLIKIKVNAQGLTITTPYKLTKENLNKVLSDKKGWILNSYISCNEAKVMPRWKSEKAIYYMGRSYPIAIFHYEKNRVQINFSGDSFIINVNKNIPQEESETEIEEGIKKWFREKARAVVSARAEYYSKLMGVKYNRISIKEQKTRWGSCSSKGNLNFNWKLIMAREEIVDYIVVHELCHLMHLNHSKDFWKEVSLYIPEYEKLNKWLRDNGKYLYI